MASFKYVAVGPDGAETRGALDVATQMEAIRRVREMGLFPLQIKAPGVARRDVLEALKARRLLLSNRPARARVKVARLMVFTRQLATMLGAGMSLLRALRILEEQEDSRAFKAVLHDVSARVENGCSFSEALAGFPRVFNALYLNLIRAGETGGALENALQHLAGFLEKSQKLRGKLKAAMFYPCAVLMVAGAVMGILIVFVVPRFQQVFEGLLEGRPLPTFTRLVFELSNVTVHRLPLVLAVVAAGLVGLMACSRTRAGATWCDRVKLKLPILGPLFRKAAISKFARTLGTLAGNGVPILQALAIVKETTGNLVISGVIAGVHDRVKQGDPIAPVLKSSRVFPPMVAGMVDVGEQTGALPEMLMKIADTYDDEFDNAAKGLMSLLEPVLIVILALIVGSIVIAMFLPLIAVVTNFEPSGAH
jgi:type IV pilus assembly protein PilC